MGLQNTAHYLKTKGRGKDTELVHMTPKEVKGLQQLAMAHGGSLTINPQTGLPEAGFLEDILPVVAAAGLTYLTAGAAAPALATALGPAAAGGAGLLSAGAATTVGGIAAGALSGAAISGLTAAATGKDAGQAALMGGLGGGIAGGLGAYSGDPSQLAAASQQVATAPTPEIANQLAAQQAQAAQQVTSVGASGLPPTPSSVNAAGYGVSIPNPAGSGFISPETGQAITSPLYPDATQAGINAANMAPGPARNAALDALVDSNKAYAEGSSKLAGTPTFYQDQGTLGRMAIQGLPAYGLIGDPNQTTPEDEYVSPLKRISPNFQAQAPIRPNPYYRAQYPTYAASGGLMMADGGPVERMSMSNMGQGMYPMGMIDRSYYSNPIQRPAGMEVVSQYDQGMQPRFGVAQSFNTGGVSKALPKGDAGIYVDRDPTTSKQDAYTAALTRLNAMQKRANIKGLPALKAAAKPLGDVEEMAGGGLGGYSDGGRMLKGPGDGMSDSIPGVIGGRQPARLADGEFVVPADVVSHLGNGSTDAGAKKLYKMMDKIRKARTGKKKQAPAVKADKYMPA